MSKLGPALTETRPAAVLGGALPIAITDDSASSSQPDRSVGRSKKHKRHSGKKSRSRSDDDKDSSDNDDEPTSSKRVKKDDKALIVHSSSSVDLPARRPGEDISNPTADDLARLEKMSGAVRTLLECIGEDTSRSGLQDTPQRYAKAMLFFTKGYQENVRDIVKDAIFDEDHNEMVIVKDIEVFSLCEHHLVPFTGKMHIGYIPRNRVVGISKLPRIAEMFSRRLQIQERLTKDVAHAIMDVVKPQGVAVVMESSHLCMVMRGVEKTGASTITSCVLGCFEKKSKTRNEFMSLVGVNRR